MNLTEPQAGSDVGALKIARGAGRRRQLAHHRHQDLHHLWRARPDRQYRPPGARPHARSAGGHARAFRCSSCRRCCPTAARNDLRCVSIEHKLGIHASPTCVMAYGDDGGATGWLIGPEHGGMRAMFTMMNNARLNVGLQGVGHRRAGDAARGRLCARAQAGPAQRHADAIAEHPDVRRMLLRMRALTMGCAGARLLCVRAGRPWDAGRSRGGSSRRRADPAGQGMVHRRRLRGASLGIQVHGGMGFIEETGAAQHLRDARIAPIYEGTNGIQAADLVQRKLGLDDGARVRWLDRGHPRRSSA